MKAVAAASSLLTVLRNLVGTYVTPDLLAFQMRDSAANTPGKKRAEVHLPSDNDHATGYNTGSSDEAFSEYN